MARFEVYTDGRGEYRWRLKHTNGQTIASGGEGYSSKRSALAGIESVKKNAPDADVVDVSSGNGDTGSASPTVPSPTEGAGRLS